jgi:C-terminal processing protease CtpA/Prc
MEQQGQNTMKTLKPTVIARTFLYLVVLLLLAPASLALAQEETPPPAEIVNDEGGPVSITGEVTYTNPRFTLGVAEPVIILEDQAGFVDRNERFLMPPESQTLGQITSDFYTSPFSYSIALPIEPQGSLRDVDHDGVEETGVQVFAVAYWTNTFGDPFLEERDLFGGGWSTAYASTRVSENAETEREIIGGKYLVYAPDDQQGFPSGFGEDGLLFTEDDPIVILPQGYTVVDMDTDPFTFDRSRHPVIDLIEPEGAALVDYSDMSYTQAFDALVEKLSKEYAFTEYKGIDWDALHEEFRPLFEEADAQGDVLAYRRALRDFSWSIPDGHVSGPFVVEDFRKATDGGLGIAIRELDDGRVIVNFLLQGSPADKVGIKLKAEILEINGVPIQQAIDEAVAWSAPFSTEHFKRLQQMRYVTRFPLGTDVTVTFRNPDSEEAETATLTAIAERDSFRFSSFNVGLTGFELPIEYKLLEDSNYAYVKIFSFADNSLLTVQLWERMMRTLNDQGVSGLIIDMRQNGGGKGFLADQMAAYFFDEPLVLGSTGYYDEDRGEFYFDPRFEDRYYLPAEELRYHGKLAVLVGPNCNSACEFFAYDLTLQDRATVVGQYPTAGLGGSVDLILMPENEFFQYTKGRAVDANGEIHIEGKGVPPDVRVPVTEETLFSEGDPILDAAVTYLDEATAVATIEAGDIAIGDVVTGTIKPGERVRYNLEVSKGDVISILLAGDGQELDTVLNLYDKDGNLLISNDDVSDTDVSSAMEELAIPVDLSLIVEVATANDSGEGAYVLSIENASP